MHPTWFRSLMRPCGSDRLLCSWKSNFLMTNQKISFSKAWLAVLPGPRLCDMPCEPSYWTICSASAFVRSTCIGPKAWIMHESCHMVLYGIGFTDLSPLQNRSGFIETALSSVYTPASSIK